MDENFDYDSGEEIAEDHVRLVDAVSRLDKTQHIHKPSRSEPTLQSSEFHLVKSENAGGSAASYTDLVKVSYHDTTCLFIINSYVINNIAICIQTIFVILSSFLIL